MSEAYEVIYAPEALDDLRDIYEYIAYGLLSPDNAKNQTVRIRKSIRGLDIFPERHTEVPWEPWKSMHMHFLPVDNYIVFYLVHNEFHTVEIVRIFHGGQDVENHIKKEYDLL